VVGYLLDRLWAPMIGAASLGLAALGVGLLALDLPTWEILLLSACLIGVAAGAELDLMSYLTARYFGMAHYGKIYGCLFAGFSVTAGFAPSLFGKVYDATGSYDPILTASIGFLILAALLLLPLGAYPEPAKKADRDH
jgi:MFS transporter, OFA family, oxalate/formate antiporter